MRGICMVALLVGCGGGASSDCPQEAFEGTPFFADEQTGGTVSGTLSWPDSIPDGELVEVGLESVETGAYVATLGPSLLSPFPRTCGTSRDYVITQIEAGEYRVLAQVQDSANSTDTGETSYLAEGRSAVVTVAGDEHTGVDVAIEAF